MAGHDTPTQIQNYMMRVNMSILVVAMAKDESNSKNSTANSTAQTCMENRNWTQIESSR